MATPVFAEVSIGEHPPMKLGRNLHGDKLNVADYQGKVLIVTFWATWCGPCMKEIPVLSGIQKKVGTDRLQVVAVNYRESKKMFKSVAEALIDNPIVFSFDANKRVSKKYGVKAIPHMVIVDKHGLVVSQHIGYKEGDLPLLVAKINRLLE